MLWQSVWTRISALVNKGTDIRIIQGYLGHKAISSTVRYTTLDSRRFAKLF